jgi:hypothetical protein
MPFLTCGGVTVEVFVGSSVDEEHVEIGDFGRAFDGTARSTIRSSYKKTWTGLSTAPIAQATADTLLAALKNATQPVACTGDLTGSINCFPRNIHVKPVAIGTSHYETVTFDLYEA